MWLTEDEKLVAMQKIPWSHKNVILQKITKNLLED